MTDYDPTTNSMGHLPIFEPHDPARSEKPNCDPAVDRQVEAALLATPRYPGLGPFFGTSLHQAAQNRATFGLLSSLGGALR